ncbi:MAG: hypothetical protein JST21_01495 [Bacteroidetes bacterium]|nr:hypothetical protein [Bacteroidota bacterium]
MNYEEFKLTIENNELPPVLPLYLQALWYDAKGNWDKAHSLIDSLDDLNSCWVHAYLHRKEGDLGNADYWYRRAKKNRQVTSLSDEWKNIVEALLVYS